MAIGGLAGAALAGLTGYNQYAQQAQQARTQQLQQQIAMFRLRQEQQQKQQQQQALQSAWKAFGSLGGLSTLPGGLASNITGGQTAPGTDQGYGTSAAQPATGQSGAGAPVGTAPPLPGAPPAPGDNAGGASSIADYIRQGAMARGIDPSAALHTASTEGGTGEFQLGDSGSSGGPFQLHEDDPKHPGAGSSMGDQFFRDTGKNPLDPANERATVDYALDYAKNHGGKFDPNIWHGLRNSGGSGGLPQQVKQTAHAAAQQLPGDMAGRFSIQAVAQAIEKANPDAPDAVKFLALQEAQKLMAPDARIQMQMLMMQNRDEMQFALQNLRSELSRDQAANKGYTFITTPDGKILRANPNTGDVQPVDAPQGAGKLGSGAAGKPADASEVEYWKTVLQNGGALPPGLARTRAGSDLVRQIMSSMSQSGDPNAFIANHATVQADAKSLANMVKMTDAATSFERTATENFDLALKLSKDAIPTDWGPWLNKWVETGETQFGDTDVPPYVTAMLTGANEYAKIMSGSTGAQGSTVDSRREAAELFSPYLSQGQIGRVVAVAKQDMANRKSSLYGQVDDIKKRLGSAGSGEPTATQGQQQPVPSTGGVIKLDGDGNPIQ